MNTKTQLLAALVAGATALAGCTKAPTVTLPEGTVERAAYCQGAYTAQMQQAADFEENGFTEAAVGSALHNAYIAATAGGSFDKAMMAEINKKAPDYAGQLLTDGGITESIEKCREAFPQTVPGSYAGLPKADDKARVVCASVTTALTQSFEQTRVRVEKAPQYEAMLQALGPQVEADFEARGIRDVEPMRRMLLQSLSESMKAGPPGEIADQCLARFSA